MQDPNERTKANCRVTTTTSLELRGSTVASPAIVQQFTGIGHRPSQPIGMSASAARGRWATCDATWRTVTQPVGDPRPALWWLRTRRPVLGCLQELWVGGLAGVDRLVPVMHPVPVAGRSHGAPNRTVGRIRRCQGRPRPRRGT